MRIAISTISDISMNEGTSLRTKRVFELLQKKYDCTLIARGKLDNKSGNVEIIRPSKFWNFQLIPVVMRHQFDLIYVASDFWGFFTYLALARLRTFKIVLEVHGVYSLEREDRLSDLGLIGKIRMRMGEWRENFAVKHADCIVALAEDIYRCYGRLNECIFIVDNFVDEKQFRPQKKSREQRSDGKERKTVGLIGPFYQSNINNYFLDFLYQNVQKFDARINFIVIGLCDYKIANERISYTGYLSDFQNYVDQLAHLDAVLVPAKFSSFGALTKVLEPMACSVPVFTTPAGLVSFDHVTPGEDILICDESELVAKVNESLFDLALMERVGKNARCTIEKYYSETLNSEKLIAVIDRVCPPESSRISGI